MSNIVAIDNFTVTSQEFVIPGGALITSVAPQAVLTISPNVGYEIKASDFAVVSSNPEVDVPNSYFTQDGDNVILTVLFLATATMPNNNLDIKICMRGASEEVGATIAGTVFYDTANATPLPQSLPYTNSGPAESTEEILSQLIQADTGYYFQSTPTISLRTGDEADYNLYTSGSVRDGNNRLTAIRVNADYTYPFVNHSGDEIDVYAHAIAIPVIPVHVTGYSISTTVPVTQTFRDFAILGVEGANYELTIDNGATFVSSGTNTVSGFVPAGNAIEQIDFPSAINGDTHTLTFVPSGSDLDPSQPSSYWTIVFDRFARSSIVISGTVSTSDSEIIVDNSDFQTVVSNSTDLQVRYIEHTINPVPTCPGLTLSWATTTAIPPADFSKTEDLPDGTFNVVNGLKQLNLPPSRGVTLRVQVATASTGSNDMSYSLDNIIETYLVKTYDTKEIVLNNVDGTVDSQFQYTDENGTVQTPTLGPGESQTVCSRLSCPVPTVLTGDGLIELTLNDCS